MITSRRAQVAARATATPWRWPPERFSTGCVIDWTPILSSAKWRVASRRIARLSSMRRTRRGPRSPRLPAEEDVGGDVEGRGDGEVLVDGLDAGAARIARGAEVHALAVEPDLALVRLQRARERLDQRRLAGAVVADDREDLVGIQLQIGSA